MSDHSLKAQVAIIGAGPAGLVLSLLLAQAGIESIVLEDRDRDYVEHRVRAGVLEHRTVELLDSLEVTDRLHREELVHHGIELRFHGQGHRIAISDLTNGRAITIYGQQEVIKDLIQARLDRGGEIVFEVANVTLHDLTKSPIVRFQRHGEQFELKCDFVAGCDGFHGVSRESIPPGILKSYQRDYPFAWLGILAAVAPSTEELIYASHEDGFALHSLRSPETSRLYIQVPPDEQIESWPDDRIWETLQRRLAREDGWTLHEGPVIEKGIAGLRSFVVEPMQCGRLFLAGDAAHIVPATGAKGLNLAVNDVRILAGALIDWYRSGKTDELDQYSESCLRRVWRAEHFSWWMTWMLHRHDGADEFQRKLQIAQLEYVCSSKAAATSLAENYAG
jgi:p-hydroxybenzoate 3-monooxygenase